METILWQKDNLCISFDEEVPCLIWKLSGFPKSSEVYRESAVQLYDLVVEKYQTYKNLSILNDASEISSILPEDVEWAKRLAIDKLKDLPRIYQAVIKANNPLGEIVTDEYSRIFNDTKVNFAFFSTKEKAKEWLKSKVEAV